MLRLLGFGLKLGWRMWQHRHCCGAAAKLANAQKGVSDALFSGGLTYAYDAACIIGCRPCESNAIRRTYIWLWAARHRKERF